MKKIVEGFEFDIPDAVDIYKFDETDNLSLYYHGVSVLKAVDVMIEMPTVYLFVEIKEYNPAEIVKMDGQHNMRGDLTLWLRRNLVKKFQDTFIYRYCEDKLDKNIIYVCLLNFESPLRSRFKNELDKFIPVGKANKKRWKKCLTSAVFVLDEAAWNRKMPVYGFGTCKHI